MRTELPVPRAQQLVPFHQNISSAWRVPEFQDGDPPPETVYSVGQMAPNAIIAGISGACVLNNEGTHCPCRVTYA